MKNVYRLILLFLSFFVPQRMYGYGLPHINLGSTSFLDGGPLRIRPGWYLQEFLEGYHSYRFTGPDGKDLAGTHSLHVDAWELIVNLAYQSDFYLLPDARPGFEVGTSVYFPIRVGCNALGINSRGGGLGDLYGGVFLQWNTIMKGDRPLFIHRFEFAMSFPTGTFKRTPLTINPGNGFIFIDPYWSATLYCTPRFSFSWRLYYLWNAKNHKTGFQAGTAMFLNYAAEYFVTERLLVGLNGYFLQQLRNNKQDGVIVPNSKERIFAAGPGFLVDLGHNFDLALFGNLYFETAARNSPQGVSVVFRLFKRF